MVPPEHRHYGCAASVIALTFTVPVGVFADYSEPSLIVEFQAGHQRRSVGVSWWPEGGGWWLPRDFAIDIEGGIWLLDALNDRLLTVGGSGSIREVTGAQLGTTLKACSYIEASRNGHIVVGTMGGASHDRIVILDSGGTLLKALPCPAGPRTGQDFAVSYENEIVMTVADSLAIYDIGRDSLRRVPKTHWISGSNASPYSPYHYLDWDGSARDASLKRYRSPGGHVPDDLGIVHREAMPRDAKVLQRLPLGESGLMLRWLLEKEHRRELVTYHGPRGERLLTLPKCPVRSLNRRPHDIQLRLGPDGSLYQMETAPPLGLGGDVPLQVDSEEIVVRVWRWIPE